MNSTRIFIFSQLKKKISDVPLGDYHKFICFVCVFLAARAIFSAIRRLSLLPVTGLQI
jgi:hypothetical protein